METAVRRIVSVKVVRTQMGQEWCSVLLHLEKETAVNYNVWTFHPCSKRFALDHQEKVQTGTRTVLETFALGQILKVATNAPEVLPLFNAVAKEAESTLKDASLQDPLCARCVHSLAAKIQSTGSRNHCSDQSILVPATVIRLWSTHLALYHDTMTLYVYTQL